MRQNGVEDSVIHLFGTVKVVAPLAGRGGLPCRFLAVPPLVFGVCGLALGA
jgi:hypothetical protein